MGTLLSHRKLFRTETEHDQLLRVLRRDAAALEVEALLVVDGADGAGVAALDVVGADVEVGHALGPRTLGQGEVAVGLKGDRPLGLLADADQAGVGSMRAAGQEFIFADGRDRTLRMLVQSDDVGFGFSDVHFTAGADTVIWFKHHWEANHILSGRFRVTDLTSGESHELGPGMAYNVGPKDRHRLQALTDVHLVSIFCPALRDWETGRRQEMSPEIAKLEAATAVFEAKKAGILEAIKHKRRRAQDTALQMATKATEVSADLVEAHYQLGLVMARREDWFALLWISKLVSSCLMKSATSIVSRA